MFEFHATEIPGCIRIVPPRFNDLRGDFVKVLHKGVFLEHNIRPDFSEQFYTVSRRAVVRGLHCQLPPHHAHRLLYVVSGAVLDAVVDLRRGSPKYGHAQTFELSAENREMLFLPTGIAHGFYTRSAQAIMVYNVGAVHAPESDRGVRWDSAGIDWPIGPKIVSDRDLGLPTLAEFDSPFAAPEDELRIEGPRP